MLKKVILFSGMLFVMFAVLVALALPAEAKDDVSSRMEQLGKKLFLDKALSVNRNQSCATCHTTEFGYTGPKGKINEHGAVYPGSIPTRFGDRKPPTAAYGGESPLLYYNEADEVWVGGMFWDGRATGWILGDPLAEQAKGPFLNPMEQALPDAYTLCMKVFKSNYARLFRQVWSALDCSTPEAVALVYDRIGFSISAFEKSKEVNPFNSKFDGFWDNANEAGMDVTAINLSNWMDYTGFGMTDDEVYGLAVFNDEEKGKCSLCHTLEVGVAGYPLFTDFTYDNLGVPKNLENPVYWRDPDFIDPGLGGFLKSAGYEEEVYMAEWGKFKVPTLRNVDKREGDTVKSYGHNGFFKSLYDITHFYNTRDVGDWPEPEYAETVNFDELGNLGLSEEEENAIVLFMQTLTDWTKTLTITR
jgi:cytochrome c peroxidase